MTQKQESYIQLGTLDMAIKINPKLFSWTVGPIFEVFFKKVLNCPEAFIYIYIYIYIWLISKKFHCQMSGAVYSETKKCDSISCNLANFYHDYLKFLTIFPPE